MRDRATQGHSQRVTAYTLLLARALDVPESEHEALRLGALLHDIGKIGVTDAILRKPTMLTPDEWSEMRKHPEWGAALVDKIDFLRGARAIIIAHHEHFDGSGYPNGLRGASSNKAISPKKSPAAIALKRTGAPFSCRVI